MEARCQCGAVRFNTPLPQPLALYICHCTSCRRQTGSAFGTSAIYPRFKLPEMDLLACYTIMLMFDMKYVLRQPSRPTPSGIMMQCYFCRQCGTRLLHIASEKNIVSVKGGCIEGLDWRKAIHIWTKSAMVPIPEGCESHSQDPSDYSCSPPPDNLSDPLYDSPGPLYGSGNVDPDVAMPGKTDHVVAGISGGSDLTAEGRFPDPLH